MRKSTRRTTLWSERSGQGALETQKSLPVCFLTPRIAIASPERSPRDGHTGNAEQKVKRAMQRNRISFLITAVTFVYVWAGSGFAVGNGLRLDWEGEFLLISGSRLDAPIKVHYIEAFVGPGSTNQNWVEKSVISHRTTLIARAEDGSSLHLRSQLPVEPETGPASSEAPIVIEHTISADADEVTFLLTARNRGSKVVDVLWAQPCIRVGEFTGRGLKWYEENHYLDACFIFLDGKLTTLDETPRSPDGFYTPGQVYAPGEINRDNLNPRPISPAIPSNGLIGCYSADESMLLATAWSPYQELFQGIATCIHADFRIGGLEPGQTKTIRGKIYIMENDTEELLRRYHSEFED